MEVSMALFYQVFAQVHPGQFNRILVHAFVLRVKAPELPAPSLVSFGNLHTLRRYFLTPEQAAKFASNLRATYAKGPVQIPLLRGSQLELF
jgi:hypothetical protein